MAVLSIPNIFVQGTTINAAPFNTNFAAIQTAVNSIDNSNIGAAGLFPSQLLPTTAGQATFGGMIGYNFLAPTASTTPLTVSGVAGQSVDIFDVTLTSGGTKAFSVGAAGSVNITQSLTVSSNSATFGTLGTTVIGNSITATNQVGAGPLPAVTGGDLSTARSVNTGSVAFGSGLNYGNIDYNVTNALSYSARNQGNTGYADIFAGTYHNVSDESLKTNVRPITDALSKIAALTPVTFDWAVNGKASAGFTAQDVQGQFPDAVSVDTDGTLLYAPSVVLAHLVQAFQSYVLAHP